MVRTREGADSGWLSLVLRVEGYFPALSRVRTDFTRIMKPSEILFDFGRPVAYYPGLVKYLGSVNAVLFFCQIFYWKDRAQSELGVYKTQVDIQDETGLTRYEQETARKQLISKGVLIETHKRLEHRIYFRIDEDNLNALLSGAQTRPVEKAAKAKPSKASPRMRKTHIRESDNPAFGADETQQPPNAGNQHSGVVGSRTRLYTEITAQTTAETTHTTDAAAPEGEGQGKPAVAGGAKPALKHPPAEQATAAVDHRGPSEAFEAAWSMYPARPGNSKPAALKAWRARVSAGDTEQTLLAGTKAYAAYCAARKTAPQYVKLASTFFGPDRHFESNWSVAGPKQPSFFDDDVSYDDVIQPI